MTNPTIPEAVAHVNSLIAKAIVLGQAPRPEREWEKRAQQQNEEAKTLTFMRGWHLEFGEEFGNRVSLDVEPKLDALRQACRVRIGTSGNQRSVQATAEMAKTLLGVAGLAHDIEAFLSNVDPQPLPEAVEAEKARCAAQRIESEKRQAEAQAAEKAKLSLRGKKASAQRKLNAAASAGLVFEQMAKLQKLIDGGKFDEVIAALSK